MDFGSVFYSSLGSVFRMFFGFISVFLYAFLALICLYLLCFCIAVKFKFKPDHLKQCKLRTKLGNLTKWILYDFLTRKERAKIFKPYGFSFFVGRQGAGKTIAMVKYLQLMKEEYPECIVVTNFSCKYSDVLMTDWRDLFEIRNDDKGVIFAIDEIHSEYSSASWRDFPESLLSEISQQRKQKVKIIASAQVLGRVVKPLREQAFSVFVCSTKFNRWTRCKEYDYYEYASATETSKKAREKLSQLGSWSFVQDDEVRNAYDTYEKIERMRKVDFIPRNER